MDLVRKTTRSRHGGGISHVPGVIEQVLVCLQVLIFSMGVTSIVLAITYAWFFHHSRHHVAGAMKAMLIEQITSSAGTLYFSANSLLATIMGVPEDQWNTIDPTVAIVVRVLMFGMMIHATSRMSVSVRRVLHEHDSAGQK